LLRKLAATSCGEKTITAAAVAVQCDGRRYSNYLSPNDQLSAHDSFSVAGSKLLRCEKALSRGSGKNTVTKLTSPGE
jgi:hypothetical protein